MAWPFGRKINKSSVEVDQGESDEIEAVPPPIESDPTELFVNHRLMEMSHSVSRQWTICADVPFDWSETFDWAEDERPTHPSVINHLKTLCHLEAVYFPSAVEGRAAMIIEGEPVQMVVRFDDFHRDPWVSVRLEIGAAAD
jgi:hypothetical protein